MKIGRGLSSSISSFVLRERLLLNIDTHRYLESLIEQLTWIVLDDLNVPRNELLH